MSYNRDISKTLNFWSFIHFQCILTNYQNRIPPIHIVKIIIGNLLEVLASPNCYNIRAKSTSGLNHNLPPGILRIQNIQLMFIILLHLYRIDQIIYQHIYLIQTKMSNLVFS